MKPRKPLLLFVFLLMLSGCSSEKQLPVVWEFTTGYPSVTIPVVSGNFALFGSDKLYCVNAVSGQPIWDFVPYGIIKNQPVVDNNKVYFQCGGMYCLDLATGKINWEFWTNSWGEMRVAVSEGVTCFIKDDTLYCLTSTTGKKLWERKVAATNKQPIISGDQVLVCGDSILFCFDVTDGKALWKHAFKDKNTQFDIAADAARVYLSTTTGIRAVEAATGNTVWTFPFDMLPMRSFVVSGDFVYIACGKIYCLDKKNGAIRWQYNPTEWMGLPVVSGLYLYVRNVKMQLCCIDLQTRKRKWEITAPSQSAIQSGFMYKGSGQGMAYCMKLPE